MNEVNKGSKRGNLFAAIGMLLTILSLTIVEDKNWKVALSAIGTIWVFYGVVLLLKAKKKKAAENE